MPRRWWRRGTAPRGWLRSWIGSSPTCRHTSTRTSFGCRPRPDSSRWRPRCPFGPRGRRPILVPQTRPGACGLGGRCLWSSCRRILGTIPRGRLPVRRNRLLVLRRGPSSALAKSRGAPTKTSLKNPWQWHQKSRPPPRLGMLRLLAAAPHRLLAAAPRSGAPPPAGSGATNGGQDTLAAGGATELVGSGATPHG